MAKNDKNNDGYDDADTNKDGITTTQEQSDYDAKQAYTGEFLPPLGPGVLPQPQGNTGVNVGTSSTGDTLWTGTSTNNPVFKNKTAVKKAYETRTLEPQFLNRIDTYYNKYGKALGYKSASSFWNDVVDQTDTQTTPWNIFTQIQAGVEAGVTPAPGTGTGTGLSKTELAAQKELKQMNALLARDPEADLVGKPGQFQETLTKFSDSMGLLKSRKEINSYVKGIMEGNLAADTITDDMRKQAEVLYSNFADRLRSDASLTVRDLANPYLQVMADTLEVDPQLVKLTDPTIQNAISGSKLRSLTDFRTDLRNDSRFATTRTAKREAADFAQSLLKGFGFSV